MAKIMPPRLHPRSKFTSTLFATTLFASFFVVALPHVLPCPAPRLAYADGEEMPDGAPRRRRRRKCAAPKEETAEGHDADGSSSDARECPIPKPTGLVGEMLGFKEKGAESRTSGGKGARPP